VRRREHDAAHVVVVTGGTEGRDQIDQQLVRQRVARVGLVQADGRDVLAGLVQQRVELGQGALRGK
jgi:hypothetical protein